MKLDNVEFFLLEHPLTRRYGDANGMKAHRRTVIVRLTTDEGLVGWGECFRNRLTMERLREVAVELKGEDAISGGPIVERLARMEPALAAGLDIALWDIRGKAAGLSLAQLMGGPFRTAQPAYASHQNANEAPDVAADAVREAEHAMELSFKALKMKVAWHAPETDLVWVRSVLEALPKGVLLALDANQGMDLVTARRFAKALPPERIAWFEEPLKNARLEAHGDLRRAVDIPVAGAESLPLPQVEAAIRSRVMDIVNPDLVGHGGFRRMQHLWSLCESFGVRLVPHVFDGQILRVATLHFLAAQPDWHERQSGFRAAPLECDVSPNPLRDELLGGPLRPDADGCIPVPTGPGLGIEIDEGFVRRSAQATIS
jgi:D-galactarolactone cycloisomerase